MSPQPQSSATTITPEGEIKSTAFKAEMSRDSSPTGEHVHDFQLDRQNDTPSPDLPVIGEESGYFSPSMGPYVPTVRVSSIDPP